MTDFIVVPFYFGEGPTRGKMETRVTGRVPRLKSNDQTWTLVDENWDLGYFVSGASAKEAISANLRLTYHYTHAARDVDWTSVNEIDGAIATRLAYTPPPIPVPELQLHDLGPYEVDGRAFTVIAVTSHYGLHIGGDRQYKSDGFYHEDVATQNSSRPELVRFVFAQMRARGFCIVEEVRD